MKMLIRFSVIILFLIFLLGCGPLSIEHERYLDSLINRHINDVLMEWGAPDRIIPDPKGYGPADGPSKGGSIYVWDTIRRGENIGYKMLWVDANGFIYRADIQGEKWLDPRDISNIGGRQR